MADRDKSNSSRTDQQHRYQGSAPLRDMGDERAWNRYYSRLLEKQNEQQQ